GGQWRATKDFRRGERRPRNAPAAKGRARLETLWWAGKCATCLIWRVSRRGSMSLAERIAAQAQTAIAPGLRVAVLVPCFNEQATIAKVVGDFRAALPHATIYVYDNNSTDRTAAAAAAAGAVMRR